LFVAVATMSALLVAGSVAVGTAATTLDPADSIELVLGVDDEGVPFNGFIYGENQPQPINVAKAECSVTAESLNGPIMNVSATSVDKKGNPVDSAAIGLVEDGLGVNLSGRGNAQDCGRVDELAGGDTETMTLTLGDDVTSRLIESVDFDFEAKFDADVQVEYLLGTDSDDDPIVIFTEHYLLTDGSDSGPDAKDGDKYRFAAPLDGMNIGRPFDGVRISMITGSVSLEGGATHPDPSVSRTVFNLLPALACGESTDDGGPDLTDNPLAAIYVGPHKDGGDCLVLVSISTTNVLGGEQTVAIGPPDGYDWDGVTAVVTIEWDIEAPTLLGIARTDQRLIPGDSSSDVPIPWCYEDVSIALADGEWFYELAPDELYEYATVPGDVCLIEQITETVEFDDDGNGSIETDDIFTQTTEVYYIWEDPIWSRS
jgi:hypothetical protein